jgi:hypothetical protein
MITITILLPVLLIALFHSSCFLPIDHRDIFRADNSQPAADDVWQRELIAGRGRVDDGGRRRIGGGGRRRIGGGHACRLHLA